MESHPAVACPVQSPPDWLLALASSKSAGTPLAGGLNNEGIFLHQLDVEGGQGRLSQLIEKRTAKRQEAQLHQRLLSFQQSNALDDLLPRVYGVLPSESIWRLFLDYIPDPVAAPLEATSAGRLLANLAFRFHCRMETVHSRRRPAVRSLLLRQCRRLMITVADCELLDPSGIGDLVERLVVHLDSQRLVLAHNDLHWDNIRVVGAGNSCCHRLIDLGSVGWNLAGAEFHVQIRQSLMGGAGEALWPHAIGRYAELSGTAPSLLKLSALWYALVRGAAAWKRVSPEASDRRRQREKRLLTRVVSRLGHELTVRD